MPQGFFRALVAPTRAAGILLIELICVLAVDEWQPAISGLADAIGKIRAAKQGLLMCIVN